jgi:flagellar hook-basal body complex protein FliE
MKIQNLHKDLSLFNDVQRKDNNSSFNSYLQKALSSVNEIQLESERLSMAFASGQADNIHQVVLAAEKADIALQMTLQIRNKILEAYQEIMRMQL